MSTSGKVVLVTGTNRGIGLELTRQLSSRGDEVIATCRSASPELKKLTDSGVTVLEGMDTADGASIADLIHRLEGHLGERKLDMLVNNAGIYIRDSFPEVDPAGIAEQFRVNSIGPLQVTIAMLRLLAKGSKVGFVTSLMGSMTDNGSGGSYGYRASKAALNAIGKSLSHDLREQGVMVALLHPGYVQTDMTSGRGNLTAEQSAKGLIERLDALTPETSGSFWHSQGQELPW